MRGAAALVPPKCVRWIEGAAVDRTTAASRGKKASSSGEALKVEVEVDGGGTATARSPVPVDHAGGLSGKVSTSTIYPLSPPARLTKLRMARVRVCGRRRRASRSSRPQQPLAAARAPASAPALP